MWLDKMRNWTRRGKPELLIETFTWTLMSPSKCSLNRQFLLGWTPSSTHECECLSSSSHRGYKHLMFWNSMLSKCQSFFLMLSFANHIIFLFFSLYFRLLCFCMSSISPPKKHSIPKSLVKHNIKVLKSPEMFQGIMTAEPLRHYSG